MTPRYIRVYFISDTGAAYADTAGYKEKVVGEFLRMMPGYRECTREEYQAKRRWQAREDRKAAEASL